MRCILFFDHSRPFAYNFSYALHNVIYINNMVVQGGEVVKMFKTYCYKKHQITIYKKHMALCSFTMAFIQYVVMIHLSDHVKLNYVYKRHRFICVLDIYR